MSIENEDGFDTTDLHEALVKIWGDSPYVIRTSNPILKKTTMVDIKCRVCGAESKKQISALLSMKDQHGTSCVSCKTVGPFDKTLEEQEYEKQQAALEDGGDEEEETPPTPTPETSGEVNHQVTWKEKIESRLMEVTDELMQIPVNSFEIKEANEKRAIVVFECACCGKENRVEVRNPVSDLSVKTHKEQKYFSGCEQCSTDIKKDKELTSYKRRIIGLAKGYGFESVSFGGPLIAATTKVTVGIGNHTWDFTAIDITDPTENGLLILDGQGKFIVEEDEHPSEEAVTQPTSTFPETAETVVVEDEEPTILTSEIPPMGDTIHIEDDVPVPEVGGIPVAETIHVEDEEETEIEVVHEEEASADDIVGDLDGIPIARGIELDEDDFEVVPMEDPTFRLAGQTRIDTMSEDFRSDHETYRANKVFHDETMEDLFESRRYTDRLNKNSLLTKLLDQVRDFTGISYERVNDISFMETPVYRFKIPGAPFGIIYVDNREVFYQGVPIDHNSITQTFQRVLKCSVIVIYSDMVEQRGELLGANLCKLIDRIRKDQSAVPESRRARLMATNRYYLAYLEDKSLCNDFFERYSPTPVRGRSNKTLAVVCIDRENQRDTQQKMIKIQRAILAGRQVDTSSFNWNIPCAIRYVEEPIQGGVQYTVTQYEENLDLFVEDGIEVVIGMLIRRHYTVKGNTPFQIVFEYRPFEFNQASVNRAFGRKTNKIETMVQPNYNSYYVNSNDGYSRTDSKFYNPRSLITMFGTKLERVNVGDQSRVQEFLKSEGFLLYRGPAIYNVTINIYPYLMGAYGQVNPNDPRTTLLQKIVGHVERPTIRGTSMEMDQDTQRTLVFIQQKEYYANMVKFQAQQKEKEILRQATEGDGVSPEPKVEPVKPATPPKMTPQQIMMHQMQLAYQWQVMMSGGMNQRR